MAKLRQPWQDFRLLAAQRCEPRISGLVAGEAGAAHSQQEASAWRPQGSVADTTKQRPQLPGTAVSSEHGKLATHLQPGCGLVALTS